MEQRAKEMGKAGPASVYRSFINSMKDKTKEMQEDWSNKYKKSIDCNNPKGFSQKAHCQARKLRQSGKETKSQPVNEAMKKEMRFCPKCEKMETCGLVARRNSGASHGNGLTSIQVSVSRILSSELHILSSKSQRLSHTHTHIRH